MRFLAALLLFASSLLAQVVHVANSSALPFEGWVRTNIDRRPPQRAGVVELPDGTQVHYVVGRATGLDTTALDLRVSLAGKQDLAIDLGTSKPWSWKSTPLANRATDWFGGQLSVGGVAMKRVGLETDGAGYTGHWRARVGPMFCVDAWITWYPDEPIWCTGEVLVTCSNAGVPDMGAVVPSNFALRIGKAQVFVLGALCSGVPLIETGTSFSDGQSRIVPITIVLLDKLTSDQDWSHVGSAIHRCVSAVGIAQLWGCGNPRMPSGFDAKRWAQDSLPEAKRRMSTFEPGQDGPAPFSGITGAQGGQGWPYGEPLLHPSAVQVIYLAACQMAHRPCHHRELDGSQVDPMNHPQLVYWDGRPHWHPGVSPDRLGKEGPAWDTHGWSGPDVQHWISTPMLAAARYTDSKAMQSLLEAQARVYLLMHTIDPRLIFQSVPHVPRATFYEGQNAVELWRTLEDRMLAERVKQRCIARMTQVIVPYWNSQQDGVIDWTRDDRLGPGLRWVPWQQAAGSYGLDYAAEWFGPVDIVRPAALKAATTVLNDAYWFWQEGNRWTSRELIAQDGSAVLSGGYDFFGTPLAVATVLRNDPTNKKARAIWTQLLKESTDPSQLRWLAPGVK